MMKFAALSVALLAGSASAFAPVANSGRTNVALNAEKSASLPFMNRPALVSLASVSTHRHHHYHHDVTFLYTTEPYLSQTCHIQQLLVRESSSWYISSDLD